MGVLGVRHGPGVIVDTNLYSSIIYLFISDENITLMNDYIDKIMLSKNEEELKIGDLVELKPKIKKILTVQGAGTIIKETLIKTSDFDGEETREDIKAFLVYFPEEDYKYTIPKSCLQLFSDTQID